MLASGVAGGWTVETLTGIDVERQMRDKFGITPEMRNDMDFIANGAYHSLTHHGGNLAALLFPQTGFVGCGFIIDGKSLHGSSRFAGELSYIAEGFGISREEQQAVISDLVALENIVLGTGGGAVLREANRRALAANGTIVYLHADPATLYERIRHSRHRPLLKSADPAGRIAELYAVRDPIYRSVAHHVIASDRDEAMRFARRWEPPTGEGPR
mgnify:CR=1 FL=1